MSAGPSCSCCSDGRYTVQCSGLGSVYAASPFDIVRCDTCGNRFTLPVPTQQELDAIYSGRYLYEVHFLILGEKKLRARAMARFIAAHFPDRASRVMELGCMYGYLLEALRDHGYPVAGLEISPDAVAHCQRNGLDVRAASVEDFVATSEERYDVIVLSHVFEHVLHPDAVLAAIGRLLNPGGAVVLAVPNSNSLQARLFGRYWGWWQVPVHINHFNEGALRRLFGRHGFEHLRTAYHGGDSLMLLLNWMNLLGSKGGRASLGPLRRAVIRVHSALFRWWYFLGNEELVVVARKPGPTP